MRNNIFLQLGSLNIQGNAKIKCESPDIIDLIANHHIFVICESWLDKSDSCPAIPSYSNFRSERERHPKAKRNSGGILMSRGGALRKILTGVCGRTKNFRGMLRDFFAGFLPNLGGLLRD